MKNILIICLLAFTMCNNNNYTPLKAATSQFEGKFKANQAGVSVTASFTVQDNQLNGTIVINGKPAIVNGAVSGTSVAGKITEEGKEFEFTGIITGNQLRLTITNPEEVNQKTDLVLQRENSTSSTSDKPVADAGSSKERNEALIGLWKNTEVLSSGSGDNYMSFSTEFFMELREDGTALNWKGRSAGAGTSRESDEANAQKGEWYTAGKTLYFVDPVTKQEVASLFSVGESGLLLSNGGSEKKTFQRVR